MSDFKELVKNLYTSKNRELTEDKLKYIETTYGGGKEEDFVKNFYTTVGEDLPEEKFNYIKDTYLKKKEPTSTSFVQSASKGLGIKPSTPFVQSEVKESPLKTAATTTQLDFTRPQPRLSAEEQQAQGIVTKQVKAEKALEFKEGVKQKLYDNNRYWLLQNKKEAQENGMTLKELQSSRRKELANLLDEDEQVEANAIVDHLDAKKSGDDKRAGEALKQYYAAKNQQRAKFQSDMQSLQAEYDNIASRIEGGELDADLGLQTLSAIEKRQKNLEISQKAFLKPKEALNTFVQENATEIASVAKPTQTPYEQLEEYTNNLYAKVRQLKADLGYQDMGKGATLGGYAQDYAIRAEQDGGELLDELYAEELKLKTATKLLLLNRTPIQADETALGVLGKSFGNSLAPNLQKEQGTALTIANNVKEIVEDAKIGEKVYEEQKKFAEESAKPYETYSAKWFAEPVGASLAIVPEFIIGSFVSEGVLGVTKLGKLLTLAEKYGKIKGLNTTAKYVNAINKNAAGKVTGKLADTFIKTQANGLKFGATSEVVSKLFPSQEDEIGFINGYFGGVIGKGAESALSGAAKNLFKVFGNKGAEAAKKISELGGTLKLLKDAPKTVLGEVGEEFGESLGQIYKQSSSWKEVSEKIKEQYGTLDKATEFVVLTGVMALGMGAGNSIGANLFTASKEAYNELPREQRAIVDSILDQAKAADKQVEETVAEDIKKDIAKDLTPDELKEIETTTEETDGEGTIEGTVSTGTDVAQEGLGMANEPSSEGVTGEGVQAETVSQAPLEEQQVPEEITNEYLLNTLPEEKSEGNTGKVMITTDKFGSTKTRYIPFEIIEQANKNDKLGGQTANEINDRGGYSDKELDRKLPNWRTMLSKPEVEKPNIILSGLSEGFKGVTRDSFDIRSDNDVMEEIRKQKSFAKIITKNGKKYIVVGLYRKPTDNRSRAGGRDDYSFAMVEYNSTTPSDIVTILEGEAKNNFKNIYRDFNDTDVINPITKKDSEISTLEKQQVPEVVSEKVTEVTAPAIEVTPTTEAAQTTKPLAKQIADLRAKEKAEYDAMANPKDKAKREKIYNKYDKLITPLLEEQKAIGSVSEGGKKKYLQKEAERKKKDEEAIETLSGDLVRRTGSEGLVFKDGKLVKQSEKNRKSIHFAGSGGGVKSHFLGTWGQYGTSIITGFKDFAKINGIPRSLALNDVYFYNKKTGEYEFPKSTKILTSDKKLYDQLISNGYTNAEYSEESGKVVKRLKEIESIDENYDINNEYQDLLKENEKIHNDWIGGQKPKKIDNRNKNVNLGSLELKNESFSDIRSSRSEADAPYIHSETKEYKEFVSKKDYKNDFDLDTPIWSLTRIVEAIERNDKYREEHIQQFEKYGYDPSLIDMEQLKEQVDISTDAQVKEFKDLLDRLPKLTPNLEYQLDYINDKLSESKKEEKPSKEQPKAETKPIEAAKVEEAQTAQVSQSIGTSPKNLRDLYNVNRDIFGLNRVQAFASAVAMDRMVGAMAKRAGVTKSEMYGRIDFKKDTQDNILKADNALFQGVVNGENVTLRNLDVDVVNGFYSPLEKIIAESKQDKMPAKQWIDKFAKGEEAKWTGLTAWLSQQEGSVSKKDILNYLKDNRINIVEVVKGSDKKGIAIQRETAKKRLQELGLENVTEDDIDNYLIGKKEPDNTKFSQYQLEGEKGNYKEVLVTLPNKKGKSTDAGKRMVAFRSEMESKYGEGSRNKMSESETQKLSDLIELARDAQTFSEKDKFKSSHFDEPNILVHLRMNTRTDAEGNKVLFLEEVQSDWGQEGKKKGFAITELDNKRFEVKKSEQRGDYVVIDKTRIGTYKENFAFGDTEQDAIETALNLLNMYETRGVQPAPFVMDTNAWVKLGLKVALKEAIAQGAVKIAWTTGEQQNDRYSLEKVVDEVRYSKNDDGTYKVVAYKNGENVSEDNSLREDKLEATLGKDVAQRIVEGVGEDIEGEKSLTGENLKVGGKGMKGFYGSPTEGSLGIVGGVAEKLFGQKVKTVEIELKRTPKDFEIWQDEFGKWAISDLEYESVMFDGKRFETKAEANSFLENNKPKLNTSNQYSIDVTPVLRAEVEKGLALFQKEQGVAKGAMVAADGRFIIYAITDPNISTPLHELAHVFEHYLTESESNAIIKSAGTKGWTAETSEYFARGFEKYLAEGKSPIPGLEKLFAKFKEWLTEIYNGIVGSDIDIKLNKPMRDIYAAMLGKEPASKTAAKPAKSERKAIAEAKIDDLAAKAKEFLRNKNLPEGTQVSGISQNKVIDLMASTVKALVNSGIEISEAIKQVREFFEQDFDTSAVKDYQIAQTIARDELTDVAKDNGFSSYREAVFAVNKYVREVGKEDVITKEEITKAKEAKDKEAEAPKKGYTSKKKKAQEGEKETTIKETGRSRTYAEGRVPVSEAYNDVVNAQKEYYEQMNQKATLEQAEEYLAQYGDSEQGLIDAYDDMMKAFRANPFLDARNAIAIELLADRMFARALDFQKAGQSDKYNRFLEKSEDLRKEAFKAHYKAGQFNSAVAVFSRSVNPDAFLAFIDGQAKEGLENFKKTKPNVYEKYEQEVKDFQGKVKDIKKAAAQQAVVSAPNSTTKVNVKVSDKLKARYEQGKARQAEALKKLGKINFFGSSGLSNEAIEAVGELVLAQFEQGIYKAATIIERIIEITDGKLNEKNIKDVYDAYKVNYKGEKLTLTELEQVLRKEEIAEKQKPVDTDAVLEKEREKLAKLKADYEQAVVDKADALVLRRAQQYAKDAEKKREKEAKDELKAAEARRKERDRIKELRQKEEEAVLDKVEALRLRRAQQYAKDAAKEREKQDKDKLKAAEARRKERDRIEELRQKEEEAQADRILALRLQRAQQFVKDQEKKVKEQEDKAKKDATAKTSAGKRPTISDLIQRDLEADLTKEAIAKNLVTEGGLSEREANKLAEIYYNKYRKILKEKIQAQLVKDLTPRKVKEIEAQMNALDGKPFGKTLGGMIANQVAAGALDSESLRAAFAAKYDIPNVSPIVAANIRALSAKVRAAKTTLGVNLANKNLLTYINSTVKTKKGSIISTLYYTSILSGISTAVVNTYGNVNNLINQSTENFVQSIIEAKQGNKGNLASNAQVTAKIRKAVSNLVESFTSFIDIMAYGGGESRYSTMKKGTFGSFESEDLILKKKDLKDLGFKKAFTALAKLYKTAPAFFVRNLPASDEGFYMANFNMEATRELRKKLYSEGLRGEELEKKVYEQVYGTKDIKAQAINEAIQELKRIGINPSSRKLLVNRIAKEIILKKLDETVQNAANELAKENTFRGQPRGATGYLSQKIPQLWLITPFVSTPFKMAEKMINYIPLYGALRYYGRGITDTLRKIGSVDAEFKRKGIEYAKKEGELRNKQLAQVLTGHLLALAFWGLSQIDWEDEDGKVVPFVDASAGYYGIEDKADREKLREALPEYTMRIGNLKFSYKTNPLLAMIALPFGVIKDSERAYEEMDFVDWGVVYNKEILSFLYESTPIKGLQEFFKNIGETFDIEGDDRTWEDFAQIPVKQAAALGANLAVDNIYKQTFDFYDPTKYVVQDNKEVLYKAFNMENMGGLQTDYDRWGRDKKLYPGETFFPIQYMFKDKTDKEITDWEIKNDITIPRTNRKTLVFTDRKLKTEKAIEKQKEELRKDYGIESDEYKLFEETLNADFKLLTYSEYQAYDKTVRSEIFDIIKTNFDNVTEEYKKLYKLSVNDQQRDADIKPISKLSRPEAKKLVEILFETKRRDYINKNFTKIEQK